MRTENNSQGIILIMIAMSLFAIQDSLIKFIFEQSTLFEIFFGRYLVAALLLFVFIKFKKQVVSLRTHYPYLTFVRVLFHFTAFSTFFVSKSRLFSVRSRKQVTWKMTIQILDRS